MLEIRTTNGETLIHDDQQPDAMVIKGYDGSRVMVHGGAWGNHKYIRKEGNRYIYPEDLQKAAKKVNAAQEMTLKEKVIKKTAKKAREIYDDRDIYSDAAKNMASDYSKAAKDKWENGGKQVAKKVGKAILKSSKIGGLIDAGEDVISADAGTRMRQGGSSNKKKKSSLTLGGASQVTKPVTDESTERSMPEKKKRPKSRQKKVVEGGKEIKKRGSTNSTQTAVRR